MSRNRCCVPGCVEGGSSHSVLHGFPDPEKNRELFNSWVYAVGGDILGLDNQYIYKLRRVCHSHFEAKYCCRFNRISKLAVPTINLPGPLTIPKFSFGERRPLQAKQNLVINTPSTSKASFIFGCDQKTKVSDQENVFTISGPLTVPKFTVAEHRPSQAQKSLLTETPSTSTAPLNFGCEQTKTDQEKENIYSISVGVKVPVTKKTKCEMELYKKLRSAKIKISKCQSRIRKQSIALRTAKKVINNTDFVNVMDHWTTSAKLFTLMQFREYKKQSKGRRFSTEEKIIALTMFKQSPKAYRYLRKIFILPARQTLLKLLNKCSLNPGINGSIFKQLQARAKKMKESHRLCALLFDEMQLRAGIHYNERKDVVTGFVTDGQETKKILADHAQVFMIRGLVKNYKQPVAYTFSSGATKACDLVKQIKDIIGQLQQVGFIVITTICDQGSNNRQAIKYLKEETRRTCLKTGREIPKHNIFIINSFEIIPIYDTPHLLKGIRNNLITKDLKYVINNKSGISKWQHLELLHKENPCYKGMSLLPTLTDSHIIPAKIPKMKVKYASQIFSRKVSSNMGYLSEKGILPAECKETADFLLFMDNLFDSVNGSYNKNKNAKPLLGPVTPNSPHRKVWREAKSTIDSLEFLNPKTKKKEHIPTVEGWKQTILGIEDIVSKLRKNYKISSFWMRHLNQDPLENFFGAIRNQGCRNINPTCDQFESAFATLLINNITSAHAPGSNCENDNAKTLYSFLMTEDCEVNTACEVDLNDLMEIPLTPVASKSDIRIMAPLEYVSGYFIKKSKEKICKSCAVCLNALCGSEKDYIKFREYAGRNWLYNPSDSLLQTISEIQDICNYILKKYIGKTNLKEYTKVVVTSLINLNYLNCPIHKQKLRIFLINQTTRFFIFAYCKNINKIAYGKRSTDNISDSLEIAAQTYSRKFCKNKC